MKEKTLDDFLPRKKSEYTKKFENSDLQKKINKEEIINCIKTVKDPEIPVNLYDLGLIYNIEIDNNNINIDMTLTNPNCPVAGEMPKKLGEAVSEINGISTIKVELVWEPKWEKSMMSEDAKLALDIF